MKTGSALKTDKENKRGRGGVLKGFQEKKKKSLPCSCRSELGCSVVLAEVLQYSKFCERLGIVSGNATGRFVMGREGGKGGMDTS